VVDCPTVCILSEYGLLPSTFIFLAEASIVSTGPPLSDRQTRRASALKLKSREPFHRIQGSDAASHGHCDCYQKLQFCSFQVCRLLFILPLLTS